jgi:hypothetical protein
MGQVPLPRSKLVAVSGGQVKRDKIYLMSHVYNVLLGVRYIVWTAYSVVKQATIKQMTFYVNIHFLNACRPTDV